MRRALNATTLRLKATLYGWLHRLHIRRGYTLKYDGDRLIAVYWTKWPRS